MLPTQDLKGRRFGKLVVTSFAGYFPASIGAPLMAVWVCKCQCGNVKRIQATNLISGNTRSCGCLRHQKKAEKHLYQKWHYEKRRGTLCEEWLRYEIFEAFMRKAGYTPRMRVKKEVRGGVLSPDNYYLT